MSGLGAAEGAFLGGRLVVWAPVAAVRERRLVIETGQQLHTLVRAIRFQLAADLHDRVPAAGLPGWEVAAAGTGGGGAIRRLSGHVDAVFALSCRYIQRYQQWQPDLTTLTADPAGSTGDTHPARHTSPLTGQPVLIGHLATLSGAHTAAMLR